MANIPNNEIWYTSTDGSVITPYDTGVFGANIISNTYSGGKGVITFDGNVTSIGNNAFRIRKKLESIIIPNLVTEIGILSFYRCENLISVTIGNSVTIIKEYSFNFCNKLMSIDIPDTVTSIGNNAFSYGGVRNINYNGTATGSTWGASYRNFYIEDGIIYYDNTKTKLINIINKEITSFTIPNTVVNIDGAFQNCSKLTSITIPSSVTSIGSNAFSGCTGLTSIVVNNDNTIYDSRDNCNAIID